MGRKEIVSKKETRDDFWVPSQCWFCLRGPCAIEVHRVDGVAVNIRGNRSVNHYKTRTRNRGTVCPKPFGLIQKHYSPHRIKKPLKRTNPEKGISVDPKWVEIEWDEAFKTVGEVFKDNLSRGYYGGGGMSAFGKWGGWYALLGCFARSEELHTGSLKCGMVDHSFGNMIHGAFSCKPDLDYCNYLLMFGNNATASGGASEGVNWGDAYSRGLKTVLIDPVLTLVGGKASEWVPIRPGTDTAFMLALIQVIIHEIGTLDEPFLKEMTNAPFLVGADGYFVRDKETEKAFIWDCAENKAKLHDDESIKDYALEGTYTIDGVDYTPAFQLLKDHIKQYTPEWSSDITDIPAATVRRIAGEFVENARIGSTITAGGLTLPYRPVATVCGRGITGNTQAYMNMLASHTLACLVGAFEVPGGHCGGKADYVPLFGTISDVENRSYGDWGVYPDKDGTNKIMMHPWTWPPETTGGEKTLLPATRTYGHHAHLTFRHLVDPPKNFPLPEPMELMVIKEGNPLVTTGDVDIVAEALKKIPFIVQTTYHLNETSDFADIILPEASELEIYGIFEKWRNAGAKKLYYGHMIRQPVVESLGGMDAFDMTTELAEHMGILDTYNAFLNYIYAFPEELQLKPGRKYSAAEIMDSWCKTVSDGAHDLEWFKENGGILNKETTEEDQYDVHLKMTKLKMRYPIPYFEKVKEAGEVLSKNLAEKEIDWWSTAEYLPLPTYSPHVMNDVPDEYNFYVTTTRNIAFGLPDIPWAIELSDQTRGQTRILMHEDTAKKRGIQDGDAVWLESEVGRQKQKVQLVQGIRPDTVSIMGQFGMWRTPIAKDTEWASLTQLTPIRPNWTDSVVGNMQGIAVKAKVYKAEDA